MYHTISIGSDLHKPVNDTSTTHNPLDRAADALAGRGVRAVA